MTTFDEAGIRYLTVSSIMAFREAPALWVLRYLWGKKDFRSPSFARSIACKAGAKHLAYGHSFDQALAAATGGYLKQLADWGIDPDGADPRSEEDAILPMLTETVKAFREAGLEGRPIASELVSSVWLGDLEAPFLSSPTFVYPDVQIHLKYTHRCPTLPQPRELMAMAIDQHVREQTPGVIYITSKKNSGLMLAGTEQLDQTQADMERDGEALQTFLDTTESREHALAMVALNPTFYQWTPELLAEAYQILYNSKEQIDGIVRAKRARIRESDAGVTHWDLLPRDRPWDAENDL